MLTDGDRGPMNHTIRCSSGLAIRVDDLGFY